MQGPGMSDEPEMSPPKFNTIGLKLPHHARLNLVRLYWLGGLGFLIEVV